MPKTNKMPAILFFTGDWLKDPAVRCCSLSARGLWMDMLCLMYESPTRGYLSLANGNAVSDVRLARMVGSTLKEIEPLLRELEDCGVYSVNESGVMYSRRMVSDEEVRENKSRAGRASAESRRVNRTSTDHSTEGQQEVSADPTALEYENENEIVLSSSHKYILNRRSRESNPIIDLVMSAIPKNRMNNPSKTREAILGAIDRAVGDGGDEVRMDAGKLLAHRIAQYYKSDEGEGEYAKRPHNWLNEDCHLADPESWEKVKGNKTTGWDSIQKDKV